MADTAFVGLYGATAGTPSTSRQSDIRSVVGGDGWDALSQTIRDRFAHTGTAPAVTYRGVMTVVRRSWLGYLLAQTGRLAGMPLTPYAGRDVAMRVLVYPDPANGGVAWDRTYFHARNGPVTVRSTKVIRAAGRMEERAPRFIAMDLEVYARDRALHFLCRRYRLRLGRWRIGLPAWLSPGTALIVHRDAGGGRFRFTMTIRRPLFGETFFQDGFFEEEE